MDSNDGALVGSAAAVAKTVAVQDTAQAYGPHFPPAAATPWVLGLAEVACHSVIADSLTTDQVSVGVSATIEHLAPTPVGARVTATATLVEIDGRRMRFTVEVHDGTELCARVSHTRAVTRAATINDRLHQKARTE